MSASGLPTLPASSADNSPSASSASSGNTRQTNSASNTASATGSGSATRTASGSSSAFPSTGQTSVSVSSLTNAPSLSTASAGGGGITLTGLPTLSGAFSYPPASVPPTSNAPYMRTSHLPESFVFIVVGGVLAFILLVVMVWRFLTAWSVNRSFKKDSAAMYTPLPDIKKKPAKQDSGMDMADLSGAKLPKSFNSVPSLFFSPTAEAARQNMIRPQSQHMPSGHYRDASR